MVGSDQPLEIWRSSLASWEIPEKIISRAPEYPWGFPREMFSRRADRQVQVHAGPSHRLAEEALGAGGSVLDVGAGGGAASLPLASWATWIAAVDTDEAMLGDLARRAERLGLSVEAILGTWPEVADHSPVADVVVCHHVFYNVSDLEPFVRALTAHARRRVVVEITDRHPLTALNPLWMRFHGLLRPERPTAEDAAAALQALGFDLGVERWEPPPEPPHHSFAEVVALARRRLCLPAEADAEVAQALQEMGVDPGNPILAGPSGRKLVTLWWAGEAA